MEDTPKDSLRLKSIYPTAEKAAERFTKTADGQEYRADGTHITILPDDNIIAPGRQYDITYEQDLGEDSAKVLHPECHLESVIKHEEEGKDPLWRYIFRNAKGESRTFFTEDGKKIGLGRPEAYESVKFDETAAATTLKGSALKLVK